MKIINRILHEITKYNHPSNIHESLSNKSTWKNNTPNMHFCLLLLLSTELLLFFKKRFLLGVVL